MKKIKLTKEMRLYWTIGEQKRGLELKTEDLMT